MKLYLRSLDCYLKDSQKENIFKENTDIIILFINNIRLLVWIIMVRVEHSVH